MVHAFFKKLSRLLWNSTAERDFTALSKYGSSDHLLQEELRRYKEDFYQEPSHFHLGMIRNFY